MPRIIPFVAAAGPNMIITYIFALLGLYLTAYLLLGKKRLKGGRLVARVALVSVALLLVNVFGGLIGFRVPLNLVTILIPTFLGVPGFALVAVMQYLIF